MNWWIAERIKMSMIATAILWSLIVCGGVGCGESTGDDGTYPDVADRELFSTLLVDAYCEAAWECFDRGPELAESTRIYWGRFRSLEDCKAKASIPELGFTGSDEAMERSVNEGRLIIDRSYTTACKDGLRDMICDNQDTLYTPLSCLQLLEGQIEEGDNCLEPAECSGGLTCRRSSEVDICYGECAPEEEEEENLCAGEVCADDEFCDRDWLIQSEECTPKKAVDAPCEAHNHCHEGLACSDFLGDCVLFEPTDAGQSCTYGESYCEPSFRCVPSTQASEIEDLSGLCVVLGSPGDPCLDTRDCRQEMHCKMESQQELENEDAYPMGECTQLPIGIGEACSTDGQCGSQNCEDDICQPTEGTELLEDGQPCTSTSQCASGYCRYDEAREEPVCQAEPAARRCDMP